MGSFIVDVSGTSFGSYIRKAEIDSIEAAMEGLEVPGGIFNREKFLKKRKEVPGRFSGKKV